MRRTGVAIIGLSVATALFVFWPAKPEEVKSIARRETPVVQPVPQTATGVLIEGRVFSENHPEGVIGAQVDFRQGGPVITVVTGEGGRFSLSEPRAGLWLLSEVRAAGCATHRKPIAFELNPGGSVKGIELELWPVQVRRGRVITAAGQPIEGVRIQPVFIRDFATREQVAPEFSDAHGEFELWLRGEELVEASHSAYVPREVELGPPDSTLEIVMQLARRGEGVHFSGVVVDEDGQLVTGARVEGIATFPGLFVGQGFSVITDSEGRFQAEVPPDSSVELHATLGDASSAALTIPSSQEARLMLRARDASISGRVTNTDGQPVTHFRVRIESHEFHSELEVNSLEGTYRVMGLPQLRTAIVWVSAIGYLKESPGFIALERREQLAGVDFVLERGRSISGVVFDLDTKRPLQYANLKASIDAAFTRDGNGTARSDAQGRFVLNGLPPKRMEVTASRSGYLSHEQVISATGNEALQIGLHLATPTNDIAEYVGVGMKFGNVTVPDAGAGYFVEALHLEGGARVAGVQVGDEVLAANDAVAGLVSTREILQELKGTEGSVVTIHLRRRGQVFQVNAVRRRLKEW